MRRGRCDDRHYQAHAPDVTSPSALVTHLAREVHSEKGERLKLGTGRYSGLVATVTGVSRAAGTPGSSASTAWACRRWLPVWRWRSGGQGAITVPQYGTGLFAAPVATRSTSRRVLGSALFGLALIQRLLALWMYHRLPRLPAAPRTV
ncbi:DUF6529 family protein [Streptomyces sp. NBC_01378]|uniref:DUF6529 family protein n=1 Tax=Streptomyces sp. NBC_01378 TaxID=2903844 RepID=UPI00386CCA49